MALTWTAAVDSQRNDSYTVIPTRLTVDELLDKLALEVDEVEANSAAVDRLGASGLEVLLLADIGHERNNVVALLDEPGEDAGGV
jgi:hypothetical protein